MDQPAPIPARQDEVWTATGHEPPVFLDEHGRRRRWVLLGGSLAGACSAAWLGALVAGAIGFSTMPAVQLRSPLLALSSRSLPLGARTALLVAHTPSGALASGARRLAPSADPRRRVRAPRPSSLERTAELAVSRAVSAP